MTEEMWLWVYVIGEYVLPALMVLALVIGVAKLVYSASKYIVSLVAAAIRRSGGGTSRSA